MTLLAAHSKGTEYQLGWVMEISAWLRKTEAVFEDRSNELRMGWSLKEIPTIILLDIPPSPLLQKQWTCRISRNGSYIYTWISRGRWGNIRNWELLDRALRVLDSLAPEDNQYIALIANSVLRFGQALQMVQIWLPNCEIIGLTPLLELVLIYLSLAILGVVQPSTKLNCPCMPILAGHSLSWVYGLHHGVNFCPLWKPTSYYLHPNNVAP